MYNQDEELLLAFINKNKIEKEIRAFGYNSYQAKKESDKVYGLSRRKYAADFLELNKNKIEELTHKDIVNLLQALLSAGITIDDESVKKWLGIIELQVMQRISDYILLSEAEEQDANSRPSNAKKKFVKKTIEFSFDDVESFLSMLISMRQVLKNRDFEESENKEQRRNLELIKYADMVEKILKKDLEARKAETERIQKENEDALKKEKAQKVQINKQKKSVEKQKNKSR